jgi:tetratricopeptide (TPR) repeat protein
MSDSGPPKPERRRYQFGLRALTVVVLFVGLSFLSGCGPSREQQAIYAYNRGIGRHNEGEYDKAVADFTEAIRLDAQFAEAYSNRGGAYVNTGEYGKAIADSSTAIRLDPTLAAAYSNRGLVYRLKGDQAKADADFAKVKELGYEPE